MTIADSAPAGRHPERAMTPTMPSKKPPAKKPAPKPKKPAGDVSKKPRKFAVWLDKGVVGCDEAGLIVDVAPGEDADAVCSDALDVLISNELDTGWREATEDDLEKYS